MATAEHSITDRIAGALRLDEETYEEIEGDERATGQAAFIVVASAFVAAAGYALRGGGEVQAGFLGAVAELIGWAIYAWFVWLVGVRLFPAPATRSNWGELARTLGYATSPRFLLILVGLPGGLGSLVRFVVGIWRIFTTVVAIRASLDCTTLRAVVMAVLASIAEFVVVSIIVGLIA